MAREISDIDNLIDDSHVEARLLSCALPCSTRDVGGVAVHAVQEEPGVFDGQIVAGRLSVGLDGLWLTPDGLTTMELTHARLEADVDDQATLRRGSSAA